VSGHEPNCSDFDPTELKKLSVEIVNHDADDKLSPTSCNIPSLEVLETLLRNYLNDPKNAEKIKYNEDQSALRITAK
jgi:hypothetical protein